MFCSKCGSEISDDSRFCPKCGQVLAQDTAAATSVNMDRRRHGFTSFYLILGVIGGPIMGLLCFTAPQIFAQTYPKASYSSIMFEGLLSMIGTIAYILILCWKKMGVWIEIAIFILGIIISISWGANIGYILISFVGIAIFFAVLHIRKDGKTTWEQLS